MLLGVAAQSYSRSRDNIQTLGQVVQNLNACFKNGCVCRGFFALKSSALSSFPLLSNPKVFQHLPGHLHKLSRQPERLGPRQEGQKPETRTPAGRAPQGGREPAPWWVSALQRCCTPLCCHAGLLTLWVLIRSAEKLGLSVKASELFDIFVERNVFWVGVWVFFFLFQSKS